MHENSVDWARPSFNHAPKRHFDAENRGHWVYGCLFHIIKRNLLSRGGGCFDVVEHLLLFGVLFHHFFIALRYSLNELFLRRIMIPAESTHMKEVSNVPRRYHILRRLEAQHMGLIFQMNGERNGPLLHIVCLTIAAGLKDTARHELFDGGFAGKASIQLAKSRVILQFVAHHAI